MAVKHLKLVCGYVLVGLVLTATLLSGQDHSPKASVQRSDRVHAQYVLLHTVLGVSAACLLFTSTGFALAGLIVFAQQEKAARAGLHYSDSPPQADARAKERRETAVHTLVAANGVVSLLWVACGYSLHSLRWALPPLPAWIVTCAAVLCAINLATGGMLAAKHSRWAPWLLPGHSDIPLNEPSRLVSLLEQVRAKCFGRRPGLPRAQKGCSGGRRLRRSASWDRLASPGCDSASPSLPSSSLAPASAAASTASDCIEVVVSGASGPAAPAAAYSPSSQMHAWAAVLDESSFHTPPRGLSRTYSEDEEVDLSTSSFSSTSSIDPECGEMFMDVLQANILSHHDDTLQFLEKLSPERFPPASEMETAGSSTKSSRLNIFTGSSPGSSGSFNFGAPFSFSPATPQQQQLAGAPAAGSPLTPLTLSSPGGTFAERKQAMTRVSATVDELLGAIVGELV